MLLLALCFLTCPFVFALGKLFYIYEWPNAVVNSFPDAYTHRKKHITERFKQNHGLGPVIDPEFGLYHTHQYSLFSTLLARLKESPYRTNDPEQASLFFIPYDVGMDACARQSDGALVRTDCPRSDSAIKLLEESPFFARKAGSDHFILHSINQPLMFFMPKGCRRM